jgi:acyl-CoA synthetase (AMP-forming)/AMP-acid ligase II
VEISAGKAAWHAWHYISHDQLRLRSGFGDLTDGGRQGNADGAQREACSRAWRGAQHEPLAILFDLGFGQRTEVSQDLGPRARLAEVRDAVVLPVLENGLPAFLAAFVVAASGRPTAELETAHQLRAQLGERLPAYMVPRVVRFVDGFPMTSNGKADRQRLASLLS